MSLLEGVLESLVASGSQVEAYDRTGALRARVGGVELAAAVARCRPAMAEFRKGGTESVALLFRPEETVESLAAAFAAFAEGLVIVPFYPNWSAEAQRSYLELHRLRAVAVGDGFASRVESWRDALSLGVLRVDLATFAPPAADGVPAVPRLNLPPDRTCAWIFTSGTSGKTAKLTEITFGNVEAAVSGIGKLDFLRTGMTVHNPLSSSHVFSFVATLGFLTLRPRRVIFSDVQYLARLPEARIGKIDGMILVPVVLHRMRSGFYEKLTQPLDGKHLPPEVRSLSRIPLRVRRFLKRACLAAEDATIRRESGKGCGPAGLAAIWLSRRVFGKMFRTRLGSPEFVVVGGAKPGLQGMAFVEVMGVRCLQGWGMTETTGPLSVCRISDRRRGAFGTAGSLFEDAVARIEDGGELVVEGPQIARGYREPDGTLVEFRGIRRTGDLAEIDGAGRLRIVGKASERITTANGLNYNPVPFEEELLALDLGRENIIEQAVVIGDGQPGLGAVFFVREPASGQDSRPYVESLVRAFNDRHSVDERLATWEVHPEPFRESAFLGPTGKLRRRLVEEGYARLFADDGA